MGFSIWLIYIHERVTLKLLLGMILRTFFSLLKDLPA